MARNCDYCTVASDGDFCCCKSTSCLANCCCCCTKAYYFVDNCLSANYCPMGQNRCFVVALHCCRDVNCCHCPATTSQSSNYYKTLLFNLPSFCFLVFVYNKSSTKSTLYGKKTRQSTTLVYQCLPTNDTPLPKSKQVWEVVPSTYVVCTLHMTYQLNNGQK